MKMLPAVIFLLFMGSLYACTSRPVEPTRTSRYTIDTTYQSKIILLQSEMDSLCDLVFPALYKRAVDSMMMVRRDEIDVLTQ